MADKPKAEKTVKKRSAADALSEACDILRNEQSALLVKAEEARQAEKFAEARDLEKQAARYVDRIRNATAAL